MVNIDKYPKVALMKNKIKHLEEIASQLEPDAVKRKSLRDAIVNYMEDFISGIHKNKAFNQTTDKGKAIYDFPITEEPQDINELIKIFKDNVERPGLNPASGGHVAYIPGGGLYPSSLGDYMADITNRYAGIFYPSPGAVRMENMLIRWTARLIGYPETSAGNLASGGSVANLIGIVSARDSFNLQSKHFSKAVIYLTEQVHHSVMKSIRIAGLYNSIIRYVPMDKKFRMAAGKLEQLIKKDKEHGLQPFLIIASAGTTDAGAVDPINEIADISEKHKLWLHVDAAYGGYFILCDEGKKILKGLHRTDSIVMDPHKGLFLPYGTGIVLVKNWKMIYQSHYYKANYMQDAEKFDEELSPADLSPELTKHFRGLRMWLPLKLFGMKPFRAALEEKIWLARYFFDEIKKIPGFETGTYPDLSVVTYRFIPSKGNVNEFNKKLLELVLEDGRVFCLLQ